MHDGVSSRPGTKRLGVHRSNTIPIIAVAFFEMTVDIFRWALSALGMFAESTKGMPVPLNIAMALLPRTDAGMKEHT